MNTRVFISATLSLGLALASSVDAFAQSNTTVDPTALGSLDAVVKYCSNVDPGGAAGYSGLRISIFGQQSAATLGALEATAQYKKAFSEARGALLSAPPGWARKSCLGLVSSPASG